MDVIFNCPKCGQELEVDAAGIGQEIDCPSCKETIVIPTNGKAAPATAPAGAEPAAGEAPAPRWGGAAVNAIASSAAAKVEKHLKVPVHSTPQDKLIAKPLAPLEVAAKESDRKLRIKTIRHLDCVDVGKDHFDETVTQFLAKVGETYFVSITTINYSHIDIASQKLLTDFGVLIVYRG